MDKVGTKTSKLVKTTIRLLVKDVAEIRKRAAEQGIPWQTYLRIVVTKALKRREEIG